MAPNTSASRTLATLRRFWDDAGIPAELRPYLEFQARRYGHIEHALRPFSPFTGRRLLDLGGGAGSLDVVLSETFGGMYDLAEFAPPTERHLTALRARGIGDHFHLDLTAPSPLAGVTRQYDVMLFVEVLEHLLVNPLLLFRDFWDHLVPGGLLLLTTPNQSRVRNRLRLLAGRSIKENGRYPREPGKTYGHVIEYTRRELDRLFWFEGFVPVSHRVVQQFPSTSPGRAQRFGVRILNSELLARWELGDDIVAVYRKGERPEIRGLDASGRV